MRTLLFLLTCVLMLIGCRKDSEEALFGESECTTENVRFSTDIQPILNNSCAVVGCHVQGGSGNGLFENYNQVRTKVDNGSLLERVVVSRDMPPVGSLESCQIERIQQWILDGAPDN